jgi:hypothetical protein
VDEFPLELVIMADRSVARECAAEARPMADIALSDHWFMGASDS